MSEKISRGCHRKIATYLIPLGAFFASTGTTMLLTRGCFKDEGERNYQEIVQRENYQEHSRGKE